MNKFEKIETGIEGLVILKPTVFGDSRGYFMETYTKTAFKELGLNYDFIQDNESKSSKGVLRGLHFQTENIQGKLVRCTSGSVFDVAVDLRKGSNTFGCWFGVTLSAENKKLFLIPPGFAHGFAVLSETAVFNYKCTDIYNPKAEMGILWNDPDIGIKWPKELDLDSVLLSEKDKKWKGIKNFVSEIGGL